MSGSLNTSTDILARLLAGENFAIEHLPDAQTAMFNTETRTLVLPVWSGVSERVYHLFVGHEVGHALWTPAGNDCIKRAIDSIDPKRPNRVKMFLNICEDVRIERKIKNRYPGLRRDFNQGYAELFNGAMSGKILPKPIDQMPFIDRLNIFYKFGHVITVPFSDREQALVDRVGAAETFDDMVAAAKACYTIAKEQAQQEQEQNGKGKGKPEKQSGKGKPAKADPTRAPAPESWDESESESAGDESGDSNDSGTDSDDDGSTAESRAGESGDESGEGAAEQQTGSGASQGTTNTDSGINETEMGGDSQSAFDDASKAATLGSKTPPGEYVPNLTLDLPKPNKNFVMAYRDVYARMFTNSTHVDNSISTRFNADNGATISDMVNDFKRKAAAKTSRRARISDSGRIDPNKLQSYRYSDDIFRKNVQLPKGKNHGFVMFVDLSSSMSNIIESTIRQCVALADFCRKIKAPFEVYGFYDGDTGKARDDFFDTQTKQRCAASGVAISSVTQLQLLSSTMNGLQYDAAKKRLLSYGKFNYYSRFPLNGTPLDVSLIGSVELVREFKAKNKLQIVNVVVLTDGESGAAFYTNSHNIIIRDRRSGNFVPISSSRSTNTGNIAVKRAGFYTDSGRAITQEIVRFCRKATGCNYVCFNLAPSTGGSVLSSDEREQLIRRGWCGLTTGAYNVEFFINPSKLFAPKSSVATTADSIMNSASSKKERMAITRIFMDLVAREVDQNQ